MVRTCKILTHGIIIISLILNADKTLKVTVAKLFSPKLGPDQQLIHSELYLEKVKFECLVFL